MTPFKYLMLLGIILIGCLAMGLLLIASFEFDDYLVQPWWHLSRHNAVGRALIEFILLSGLARLLFFNWLDKPKQQERQADHKLGEK